MSSKKRKKGNHIRDATKSEVAWLLSDGAYDTLCIPGYTRLSENPEVVMAVNKIASLIGSMTIHLMENADGGDVRVKNALSRKLDIDPNRYMTRMTLISYIVRTMLLDGAGNAVVIPQTERGYLGDLVPVPASRVAFLPTRGFGYSVLIDGVEYDPGDLLHFVTNPDPEQPWMGCGFRVALKDVVGTLKQAAATKKGFMSDKWKPSLIIQVDSNAEELSTQAGRDALLRQYVQDSEAGKPWMLPGDLFKVEQIKPLSLNDLAVNDSVTLDKKTVAAILGVPPYVVGAGSFNREEWNAFINTTVLPIVRGIEQELTRKLLISDRMYFHMNPWALYSYDVQTLASIGSELYVRGLMDGNEVRSWIGQGPREGLDQLVILENFIPASMIGDQEKLNQQKKNQKVIESIGGEN